MKLNFIKRSLAVVLAGVMIFTGSTLGNVFAANGQEANESSSIYKGDFSNQVDPKNALHMSKVANKVGNGVDDSYNISLEAYTTGTVQTETKSVPTDIVLVLDQSGSMNYGYTRYNGFTTLNDNGVEVDVTRVDINHNFFQYDNGVKYKWEYVDYDYDNYGFYGVWKKYINNTLVEEVRRYIDDGYNEDIKNWSYGYSVSKMFYSNTRIDALKSTAKAFVESVSKDATDNQVDHRIAIVGFANDAKLKYFMDEDSNYFYPNPYIYHNSFFYSNGKIVNYVNHSNNAYKNAYRNAKSSKNLLIESIDDLQPKGATAADLGFDMAKSIIFNNDTTARNKVVVFISDGECSSNKNGRDTAEVNQDVISKARTIKGDYNGKIYSISINPAETSKDFMKAVSSGEGCYLEAKNSSELTNIFEKITSEISSPSISLNNGELRDIVSDYFQAPEVRDITVQTAKFIGGTAENPEFTTPEPLKDAQIEISGKRIVVKGFDYNAQYLRTNGVNYDGSKLIVSFNVKREKGFIGGNNVPTNGSASGIYEGNKRIEPFVQPTVNVPLKFDFSTKNGAVYITKDLKDPSTLFNELKYELDGVQELGEVHTNQFVDVNYIIKDNRKEVARYTIEAGSKEITLVCNELYTKELNEDHRYQIQAIVKPSQASTVGETVSEKTVGDKSSTIFIYKPTIKAKDSELFLGDTTNLEKNILGEIDWKASSGAPVLDSTIEKPTLNYSFRAVDGTPMNTEGTLTPQETTKLKVYVNAAGDVTRDITNQTKIISTDGNEGRDYNFKVDVVTGTIIIEKEIPLGSGVEEGDPIFTFKIASDTQEFYRTVRFDQNDKGKKIAEEIKGLPKGIYTITELKTLRYQYQDSSVLESTAPTLNDAGNKSVKVAIGHTSEECAGFSTGVTDHMAARSANIRFTNTREARLGRPTDTDVVTNRFVIGKKVQQIVTANTLVQQKEGNR